MTEVTPEQKKQLEKLGAKLFAKSFWNGIHHALMAVVMNIVLFMAVQTFLEGNAAIGMIGAVAIGIFTMRRMHSVITQDIIKFQESAKKILQK